MPFTEPRSTDGLMAAVAVFTIPFTLRTVQTDAPDDSDVRRPEHSAVGLLIQGRCRCRAMSAHLARRGVDQVVHAVTTTFGDPLGSFDVGDPDQFDMVLSLGSKWTVHDPEPISSWIHDELQFLRRADDRGIPVLGVCFGAQALAIESAARLARECHLTVVSPSAKASGRPIGTTSDPIASGRS